MESELKQVTPTDNEIMHLAVGMTRSWRNVGQQFGLAEPELDQIEGDNTTGIAATYGKLAEALNHNPITRSDLCMKYHAAKHGGKFKMYVG